LYQFNEDIRRLTVDLDQVEMSWRKVRKNYFKLSELKNSVRSLAATFEVAVNIKDGYF